MNVDSSLDEFEDEPGIKAERWEPECFIGKSVAEQLARQRNLQYFILRQPFRPLIRA